MYIKYMVITKNIISLWYTNMFAMSKAKNARPKTDQKSATQDEISESPGLTHVASCRKLSQALFRSGKPELSEKTCQLCSNLISLGHSEYIMIYLP